MRTVDLIQRKRDGEALTDQELRSICNGAADGTIPDYQVTAFLMATYLKGMTDEETALLTMAMAESGEQIDLSSLPGVKVDKHSTGGVGDTTTLVLAPLAAACGATVAKMSGRGLGHTGGTLDKMESIPGLTTKQTREQFLDQVRKIGVAVISQTPTLVPADSKFYGLRDVTATVDSIPLIASSVMSKKIASGAQVIVLDVKTGRGAFMKTLEDSRKLARSMVDIGRRLGRQMTAVITDMDVPLGNYIGNALEVREAIEILAGKHAGTPLWEVSLTLCGHMLSLADLAIDPTDGRAKAEEALRNGAGLRKLREMIEAQGGDGRVVEDLSLLPEAGQTDDLSADRDGWIASIDALAVGEAAMRLGAGRAKKDDVIDPSVGVVLKVRAGQKVSRGEVIATMHVNEPNRLPDARERLANAFKWSDSVVHPHALIREVVS